MAWWSKESDRIKEKIEEKKVEIKEAKTIKMRISAVKDLLDGIPVKLDSAYRFFYISGGKDDPAGYLDDGKSIDADNMNGTGKSRISLLKEETIDILERISTFKTKVTQLITKKENELKNLEQQYREALRREREETSG